MERKRLAAGVGGAVAFVALAAGGFIAGGTNISPLSNQSTTTVLAASVPAPPDPNCEFGPDIPSEACFAAGIIRNVSLSNLQGASQFCKWRTANPGEWNKLTSWAQHAGEPNVIEPTVLTWMGNHIKNDLQAYFVTGAPAFQILPNTAPNACTGKLLSGPVVSGVTPGQTDATVTVTTTNP